jgi:hypothetical protein
MHQCHNFIERTAAAATLVNGVLYRGSEHPLDEALVGDPPDVLDLDDTFDPSYAGGIVVAIDGARIVLQVAGIPRVVQVDDDTIVWKEVAATPDAIELGDWIDVRGIPQANGTLLARSGMVLVNVGCADGTVATVNDHAITLAQGDRCLSVPLSDRLEVVSVIDGRPRCEHLKALVPGMLADVIGLVLADGTLLATRIAC